VRITCWPLPRAVLVGCTLFMTASESTKSANSLQKRKENLSHYFFQMDALIWGANKITMGRN
jgi:hypothetical protein